MINGKSKNPITNKLKRFTNVFSSFTSKANNINSIIGKQTKSKPNKPNVNIFGKTESNKSNKIKKIIHRNNNSVNFENSNQDFLNHQTFEQLNNNFTNLIFNPITLGNDEKNSLFKKDNQKKLKKNLVPKQKNINNNKSDNQIEHKQNSNVNINNNNNNENNLNNNLSFHRCKSESNLKKTKIYSPTYYGYQIIFPSNYNKSQSNNNFIKSSKLTIDNNNKIEESQKILSVKVVYYLEYIENIILIQKLFRGFLLRHQRKILNEKINDFSNHICFAILIHANLYKKYFLKSLQSYHKNIIYKSPFKPSLNKKINNKNLIANNYSNNNKFNNNNEKQNILFRSYEKKQKEIQQINSLFSDLEKKDIISQSNNLTTKSIDFVKTSTKASQRGLKIQNINNFELKSKTKLNENFSKYIRLYMNEKKEKEQLINQLNQPNKFKEPLSIKKQINNQIYIPKKKEKELIINSNLNEINIIGNDYNNKENEIIENNINNNNISAIESENRPKTYNQSTYFFVDKNNSNSSPTVITINNTLSSNRKKKMFSDLLPEYKNLNLCFESNNKKSDYLINTISSIYIKPQKISSFNSLSISKEKENNIESKKYKKFDNLLIHNETFNIQSLFDNKKKINFSESSITFSILQKQIYNKQLNNFEYNNINNFFIKSNKKTPILEINKIKNFYIHNNEVKKFKNILESNIQSLYYESIKKEDKKLLEIKNENFFIIDFKKKKPLNSILKINTNEQINIIQLKVLNKLKQNEIIKNNFEIISNKTENFNQKILEQTISFNIIQNQKNKNDNNNLSINHINIDYISKKIQKSDIIMNNNKEIELNHFPIKLSNYIKNYNKAFIFNTIIEYMKNIKMKNKIDKKRSKYLNKFINKKDITLKSNYFRKYKDIIKMDKIIEKVIKKYTANSINNSNNKAIESKVINFSIDKKISENVLKINNEITLKLTNKKNNELKLKNKFLSIPKLELDNLNSKTFSKKIISMKSLKTSYTHRKNLKHEQSKRNNPLFNSARIILKKKTKNSISDIKKKYLQNLIKIKNNQIKKLYFTLWKNYINPNELFTFRSKDNIKIPNRYLRVKYINKSAGNNSKDNSLSSNSSKGYKQMKIIHKIYDGSGEVTSINGSRSSKYSETFTNVFDNLTIKDSLLLDRFMNMNKLYIKSKKYNNFSKWKTIIMKIRRANRKIACNKKNLVKYFLMMMIYNFTYLEPLKKSLDNRRDYLLGKSLFIWYRHFYCFNKWNNN